MGIQGLLPILKPIQRQRHLSDFAGQVIAVDAYVWLHRGAYGCASELVTGKPTRKYVDFCMQRVRLLKHHGISPYLVFDGGPLPAKLVTEKERERKRAESIEKANALAKQGRHTEARDHYVKCVDITPQMAFQVIKVSIRPSFKLHYLTLAAGIEGGKYSLHCCSVRGRCATGVS